MKFIKLPHIQEFMHLYQKLEIVEKMGLLAVRTVLEDFLLEEEEEEDF